MNGKEKTLEKLEASLTTKKVIGENNCWLWQGAKDTGGYGKTQWKRKQFLVHRLSAWLFKGFSLESDLHVCHHCDNPICYNPEHLFVGTSADNTRDKVAKKRHHWGERTPSARLTEAQVLEIKQQYQKGVVGYITLAKKYRVSMRTIVFIIKGINWKHVQVPTKQTDC